MTVKPFALAVMVFLILSEGASALSCMRPDLAATMEQAKSSEKHYYVLVGRFQTDTPSQPIPPHSNQFETRPSTVERGWFDGYMLTPNEQTDYQLFRLPIDIETSCAGPWCGSAPSPEREHVAFVEARPNQIPILRISACPEWVHNIGPNQGEIKTLRGCFDKACKSKPSPKIR